MRYLPNLIAVVLLLAVTGYRETAMGAEQALVNADAVSGKLDLRLYRREAIGLYVRFELEEHATDGTVTRIAQSAYTQITENPVHFSLSYPSESISQQNEYALISTVVEDPEGKAEITTMSSPVLTQGHPNVLNMAIQQAPEPIE